MACIQVQHNLGGFIPATIEIQNDFRVNIFLHFVDMEVMNPPNIVHDTLFVSDLSDFSSSGCGR